MERTILHCDMNNFYASVECIHHSPRWRETSFMWIMTAVLGDI